MNIFSALRADRPESRATMSPAEATAFASRRRTDRIRSYVGVVVADVLAITLGLLWATFIWFDQPDTQMLSRLYIVQIVLYFCIAIPAGAYNQSALAERRRFVVSAMQAMLVSIGVAIFVLFALKSGDNFSRGLVFLSALSSVALVAVIRYLAWPRLGSREGGLMLAELIIVDGTGIPEEAGAAIVCAEALGLSPDTSSADSVERVCALAGAFDRVVVHCPAERRAAWAETLRCMGVRCELRIPELDPLRPLSVSARDGTTTAVISERPLDLHQMVLKRCFDLTVTLALLPLLLPLMAIVAIAIKLDSKGPVFFRQRRLGIGNRSFMMLKFRSMYVDRQDKDAKQLTTRGDKRVTRVGAFIRKTSIDELPQFFNVLMGDMSIVGPRPHALMALAGTRLYWEVDQKYWYRHVAKPGITGLAQVRGFRGNTFEENDLRSRLASDLEYVSHWSLLRDIEILLATVRVLRHDKAF